MLVLDTCTLIFDALEPHRLSSRARNAIEAAQREHALACADISLWEVAMLVEHGRLDPGTDTLSFIRLLLDARGIVVKPITAEIASLSVSLSLHGDPADRLIAATAIHHGGVVVTADRGLRTAEVVPTIW